MQIASPNLPLHLSHRTALTIQTGRGCPLESNPYIRIIGIPFAVALKHQNPDQVFIRIRPTLCAKRASVPKGAGRQYPVGFHLRRVFYYLSGASWAAFAGGSYR